LNHNEHKYEYNIFFGGDWLAVWEDYAWDRLGNRSLEATEGKLESVWEFLPKGKHRRGMDWKVFWDKTVMDEVGFDFAAKDKLKVAYIEARTERLRQEAEVTRREEERRKARWQDVVFFARRD